MEPRRRFTKGQRLYKREKLCSKTAIDRLFAARIPRNTPASDSWGNLEAHLCYPLRMVTGQNPGRGGDNVQFLISVPKKRIRHAVDRVMLRRRIREAYRLNRDNTPRPAVNTDIAFIYVADKPEGYARINRAMQRLLALLS